MLSKYNVFISANDTECGKSFISMHLLYTLANIYNLKVFGFKPIASGIDVNYGFNLDIKMLEKVSTYNLPNSKINKYVFKEFIAPHLAAQNENKVIRLEEVASYCSKSLQSLPKLPDFSLIEGAGGWYTPLNKQEYFSDLAKIIADKVFLIVPIKLGCLNIALLSVEAMINKGINLAGFIPNIINPNTLYIERLIKDLQERLPCPLLFTVPYIKNHEDLKIYPKVVDSINLGIKNNKSLFNLK